MRFVIIIIILLIALLIPIPLVSCITIKATKPVDSITGTDGIAVLNINEQPFSVTVSDQTNKNKVLSGIKIEVAEQQGVGLVYASDSKSGYFPKLEFLNLGLSKTTKVNLPVQPVVNNKWQVSNAIDIDINPDKLPKAAEIGYSEFSGLLKRSYPDVKTIVFLTTEKISKIEKSQISVCKSPFPEVIYAYLHEGTKTSNFETIPKAYADIRTKATAVVVFIIASPIDDIVLISLAPAIASKFEAVSQTLGPIIVPSILQNMRYCRFQYKLHSLWSCSGYKDSETDGYGGQLDWEYVLGNFNDLTFTGKNEVTFVDLLYKYQYQVIVDAPRNGEITEASFNIQKESFQPNPKQDLLFKLSGSAVRRKDLERPGTLYFQLDKADEIEFSLAGPWDWRTGVYAASVTKNGGCYVKKISANASSYIKLELSPDVPKARSY